MRRRVSTSSLSKKKLNFENLIKIFSQRNSNKKIQKHSSIFNGNNNTAVKNFKLFQNTLEKLYHILAENNENVRKTVE